MRTSLKSRLFLLTYGVILAFIVGLIVLNNTFLERYYTSQREKTLVSAFEQIKDVSISNSQFDEQIMEVEGSHNIMIQVLYEPYMDSPPIVNEDPNSLEPPFDRLYGNPYFLRDHVMVQIISQFSSGSTSTNQYRRLQDLDSSRYHSYLAELTTSQFPSQDQFRMLALCVQERLENQDAIYYVMTISFQSIRDNIAIFNAFTILIGALFMVISGFVLYFTSYQFTNPILAMNQVTQDLSNLDFSQKVEVKTNDELGDLGNSINKMSTELERSIKALQEANQRLEKDIELKNRIDEMRKEFIASASHELKTPISLILGYSEALKLPSLDKQSVEEYLNIIIDESNKMNKMVQGLLKLSQLESGFQSITITSFDLHDFVEETSHLVRLLLDEAKIHYDVEVMDALYVESDYDALQTVLLNYLTNAIHHVDEHKIIRIFTTQKEHGWIRLTVENTGMNIPTSELERIWDSFYKVDKARTRSYGGQGLGLSIVKTTLNNLGYRYGVLNLEGKVQFYVEFPLIHPSLSNNDTISG